MMSAHLPNFTDINPIHVEPTLKKILAENRQAVNKLLTQKDFKWENLMQPLEEIDDHLNNFWSKVSHLNSVVNSPELRAVYEKCLPLVSEYATEVAQNTDLCNAVKSIKESPEFKKLKPVQQKIIDEELRDFHLSGVDLEPTAKKRFADLQQQLSKAMNKFEENVLDATQGWTKVIEKRDDLTGVPEYAIQAAAETAQKKNLTGWLFTLEAPSYLALMTFANNRNLREEMYRAYVTRASDQGPNAGRWDNSAIMQEILNIRQQMAKLLGFANFAELSIATKTAKSAQEVLHFLQELADHSLPIARKEFEELKQFAKEQYHLDQIQPWDALYLSEKLCQHRYALAQEQLRPYFPEYQVTQGLFEAVEKLFSVHIKEEKNMDVWHPDVKTFSVFDSENKLRGHFYFDLYARENKRGGAWMDECRARRRLADATMQLPVVFLTCNFSRPIGNDPALWMHDEVLTLFHEFGHGLQALLSKVDYASASGTSNVPWDVVEFPSQFMENWCWEKPALLMLTKNYISGEVLPEDLFNKLLTTKKYQAAMHTLRQVEFASFDFRLHMEFDPTQINQIQTILNEVRTPLTFLPIPQYNRFQHGFAHIFSGGYAAGYYSYKWAEVWACDAFSKFEENGIFDRATGESFLHTTLEKGSSEDPLKMFIDFRGRAPKIDALLKQMDAA
jgi:oligopeptidase A